MGISINCDDCNNEIGHNGNVYCDNCYEEREASIKRLEDQVADLEGERDELKEKLEDAERERGE